ncbi:MAG: hypothetical protein B7Z55_19745 [Planctomycetales bacterium 12-60-4]|nr:MAG: hypothetical protein B7Z55_19745 [Planctomycetales bacterium 12-60-4]
MLLWKRRDIAGAMLIGASLAMRTSAQEETAAVEPVGRATVTPMEHLQEETAQQRWASQRARRTSVGRHIRSRGNSGGAPKRSGTGSQSTDSRPGIPAARGTRQCE